MIIPADWWQKIPESSDSVIWFLIIYVSWHVPRAILDFKFPLILFYSMCAEDFSQIRMPYFSNFKKLQFFDTIFLLIITWLPSIIFMPLKRLRPTRLLFIILGKTSSPCTLIPLSLFPIISFFVSTE